MTEQTLSQKELDERIAILKRYRALLEQQRNKFQEYLAVLEKQSDAISAHDAYHVSTHAQIEDQLVSQLANLQKVITPMEKLYEEKHVSSDMSALNPLEADPIPELKNELNKLKERVLLQNRQNREMIQERLIETKPFVQNFRNPYSKARSIYAHQDQSARLVSVNS